MHSNGNKNMGAPRKGKPCEPAAQIVRKFGGEQAITKPLGLNQSAAYRWQTPRERGGTGGIIPPIHWDRLLASAKRRKIKLERGDFSARG